MKARSKDAGGKQGTGKAGKAAQRAIPGGHGPAVPPSDGPAGWLGRLRLGEPQPISPYTLHPLFLDEASPSARLLLTHEAIEAGLLHVLEQGEGVVQELLAWNGGPAPVVILEATPSWAASRTASSRAR